MHYYKRNIGDYHKKAGRLSMLEHGSYTLLIDACYDRERFPTIDEAIEWTWARTDEEIAAVKFVLSKFFTLENGVYLQSRIADEIDTYRANALKNKEIAIAREEARRSNRERSEHEPCTDLHLTTNQEPVTTNQEDKSSCDQQAGSHGQINGSGLSYTAFQDAYNRICVPTLSACRAMSKKRQTLIKSLVNIEIDGVRPFRKHGIPFVEAFFTDCLKNPHWTGNNDRGWKANFDFLIRMDNAIRVLEENL